MGIWPVSFQPLALAVGRALCVCLMSFFRLAACKNGEIFNQTRLGTASGISLGARQRLIFTHNVGEESRVGLVKPGTIICAEPSPDVASIVATTVAASLSAKTKGVEGGASLSASQSEGIMALGERTASIQLLRDQMYRACEAYANGAITGTTYSVMLSRIHESMATLMLGETAGGRFSNAGQALTSSASGQAQAALSDLSQSAEDAQKKLGDLGKKDEEVKLLEDQLKVIKEDESKGKDSAEYKEKETELNKAKEQQTALRADLSLSISTFAQGSSEVKAQVAAAPSSDHLDAAQAKVLVDFQRNFLMDDHIAKAFVTSCLVDLSIGSQQSKRARDIQTKAIDFVESDIAKKAQDLLEQKNFNKKELDELMASARQLLAGSTKLAKEIASVDRYSSLAGYCKEHLERVIDSSLKATEKLKLEWAKTLQLSAEEDMLKALEKTCPGKTWNDRKECAELTLGRKVSGNEAGKPATSASRPDMPVSSSNNEKFPLSAEEIKGFTEVFGGINKTLEAIDKNIDPKAGEDIQTYVVMRGYVEELQTYLRYKGESTPFRADKIDGVAGPQTRESITALDKDSKGKVTVNVVGKALDSPWLPEAGTLTDFEPTRFETWLQTNKGGQARLKAAQKQIKAKETGQIDEATRKKINTFRKAEKLPETGRLTHLLLRLIEYKIDQAKPNKTAEAKTNRSKG